MSRASAAVTRLAEAATRLAGHVAASLLAMLAVALWLVAGPATGYSDTWLLVASAGTSVVAFLMVFLIQLTQNRDAAEVHRKLDVLLRMGEDAGEGSEGAGGDGDDAVTTR